MPKLSPTTAFYLRNGFDAFNGGLIQTALYVYFARTLAVTPFELGLISAAHMLAHVAFELPTGIVADVYSRKASVLIGGVLVGICYILTGAVPLFAAALIATFIEAIGDTFVSGALDAWLTDEIGVDKVGAVILRSEQLGTPVHWAGVASSVLLATLFSHQVPILLGGLLWLVATVVLMALMPETGFVRRAMHTSSRSYWRDSMAALYGTFGDGVRLMRQRRILLLLLAAQTLIGAFVAALFGFDQLHLFTNFDLPTLRAPWFGVLDESAWIAIFAGVSSLLYLVGIAWLRRRFDLSHVRSAPRILLSLFVALGVGAIVFAFAPGFGWAALALCMLTTLNNLTEPVVRTWLNQHITSDVRATVLSMNTQAHRLGMLGGGVGIGALGNVAGLRVALAAAVLFLLPLLWLLKRTSATSIPSTAQANEVRQDT